MISIIIPTFRIGGLDVLFEGLKHQTNQNFELVLVDGLYQYRKGLVLDKTKSYSFKVVHIEPRNNKFPFNQYCGYVNSGLSVASGDIVLFGCDYMFFHPQCCEQHANFHQSNDRKTALFAGYQYNNTPKLKRDLVNYRPPDWMIQIKVPVEYEQEEVLAAQRYNKDVKNGKLNDLMWSIFDSDFKAYDMQNLTTALIDERVKISNGPIDSKWCFLKNESYKKSFLTKHGGFNELFDGSHGYQDSEFSGRMVNRGMKLINDPIITSCIINPRKVLYFRERLRSNESNFQLYNILMNAGFPKPITDFVIPKSSIIKQGYASKFNMKNSTEIESKHKPLTYRNR